jgi:hypothetical protein
VRLTDGPAPSAADGLDDSNLRPLDRTGELPDHHRGHYDSHACHPPRPYRQAEKQNDQKAPDGKPLLPIETAEGHVSLSPIIQ